MNGKFKTCARGHYYSAELDHCPYCPSTAAGASAQFTGSTDDLPTEDGTRTVDINSTFGPTTTGGRTDDETKTTIIGGFGGGSTTTQDGSKKPIGSKPNMGTTQDPNGFGAHSGGMSGGDKTLIFDDTLTGESNQFATVRSRRKLVGWLVSYTLDPMGVDFKLYEGRNIIGRKADCQITIADSTVSGQHAVILFRAGKYSITDQQSSMGTFVNDEDIELEPKYLNDGDIIRIGRTTLRFRSAL